MYKKLIADPLAMNKYFFLHIGAFVLLLGMLCLVAYLVFGSNIAAFSISAVLDNINHLVKHWPVLAAGLIPIYVALVVFGLVSVSLYFGSILYRWLKIHVAKKKSSFK